MKDIKFMWAGKTYVVKSVATEKTYIVLPNRTVIQPTAWTDSDPAILDTAEVVEHPFEHTTVGEIAEHFSNSILAWEDDLVPLVKTQEIQ